MTTNMLKGNFKTQKEVTRPEEQEQADEKDLTKQLKKAALNSIGGSMVYVERTELSWDGEDK